MTAPYYTEPLVTLYRANALDLPLDDETVDLVITSPPYFGLRSYQDNGEHYAGQIGAEATPAAFVDALIAATREMVRVLKPSGSIWVNLGDKYAGGGGFAPDAPSNVARREGEGSATFRGALSESTRQGNGSAARKGDTFGLRPKSLIGVPWRYALRCIDDLGLILRAEVIWSKPNGLPESVTDRVRRSHETWFHFTRQPRYFSAVDEVREAHGPSTSGRNPHGARGDHYRVGADGKMTNGLGSHPTGVDGHLGFNSLGKLPGSVWTIPTQPLRVPDHLGVDHFAAFPMEWPRRIIKGWSPGGVCVECGDGRRPTTSVVHTGTRADRSTSWIVGSAHARGDTSVDRVKAIGAQTTITGYACSCPEPAAPTRPAVVLDPFGGTGTTALVAKALGRHGISVDLSGDYTRLARWRVTDPGELARALEVEKPPTVMDDQGDLLEGMLA